MADTKNDTQARPSSVAGQPATVDACRADYQSGNRGQYANEQLSSTPVGRPSGKGVRR